MLNTSEDWRTRRDNQLFLTELRKMLPRLNLDERRKLLALAQEAITNWEHEEHWTPPAFRYDDSRLPNGPKCHGARVAGPVALLVPKRGCPMRHCHYHLHHFSGLPVSAVTLPRFNGQS